MTMLAISQNPERVSNILRSSTLTMRLSGTEGDLGLVLARGGLGWVTVVMLLSLLVGCRR